MPSYVTPKKNAQYIFYVSLRDQADTKLFKANPTIAAGDFKVSTDGGALGNLGTLPAVAPAGSKMVKITLSASEMNGDNVTLICSDAAGAEWCDLTMNIQTSARQIDDLAYPTVSGRSVDVATGGEVGVDFSNINGTLDNANIGGNAITNDKIGANAIGSSELASGCITSAQMAADSIDASALATDAVNEIRNSILSDSTPFNGADIAAILTDTGTTLDNHLTDIKGTGFVKDTHSLVNIEGYVDEVEDKCDQILADHSTINGKLDTIDGIVDSILFDTDTTIPGLIAALNDLSKIDVAAAFADTDIFTSKLINITSGSILDFLMPVVANNFDEAQGPTSGIFEATASNTAFAEGEKVCVLFTDLESGAQTTTERHAAELLGCRFINRNASAANEKVTWEIVGGYRVYGTSGGAPIVTTLDSDSKFGVCRDMADAEIIENGTYWTGTGGESARWEAGWTLFCKQTFVSGTAGTPGQEPASHDDLEIRSLLGGLGSLFQGASSFQADVSALALEATLTAIKGSGWVAADNLAEIAEDVAGLNGDAMRGTDSAALASVCTEGRLSELDAANLPASIDDILADTGTTIPGLIGALNDISPAEVNTQVAAALLAIGLDHLLSVAVVGADIADNSIIAKLVSKSGTADWDSFDNTTDSLEALADAISASGLTDWTTLEKNQIRHRLNIDGTQAAPVAGGAAKLAGTDADMTLKSMAIVNSAGDAFKAESSGGNGNGMITKGNGSGHGVKNEGGPSGNGMWNLSGTEGNGMHNESTGNGHGQFNQADAAGLGDGLAAESGGGASGDGARFESKATNGIGLKIKGKGTGDGVDVEAGLFGNGIHSAGGACIGHGVFAEASGGGGGGEDADAIRAEKNTGSVGSAIRAIVTSAQGDALKLTGGNGSDDNGIHSESGSGATGDAIRAESKAINGTGFSMIKAGSGKDIDADEIDQILADTNELQGDWTDGGRLDLILDDVLVDTNETQTKLPTNNIMGSSVKTDKDDEIDAIKAKTDNLPSDPTSETNATANKNSIITEVDANEAKIDIIDTNVDAIKLKTDNLPHSIKKATAIAKFKFVMLDATTGNPTAGFTITAARKLDADATWSAMPGSVTIVDNGTGVYSIDIAAADTNGDTGVWRFTAPGAETTLITFVTEAV